MNFRQVLLLSSFLSIFLACWNLSTFRVDLEPDLPSERTLREAESPVPQTVDQETSRSYDVSEEAFTGHVLAAGLRRERASDIPVE